MAFLTWLEATGLGVWVRESYFGYPLVLAAHSIGMAIVVGVVLILCIRVLGYARLVPMSAFETLFNVAWVGFIINAVSGVLLFCGNASHLAVNWAFLLKIALIIAGGVSLWILWKTVGGGGSEMAADGTATAKAKTISVITILFWLGAILAGRLIGYTIQYF
jgi:hypothetical protein